MFFCLLASWNRRLYVPLQNRDEFSLLSGSVLGFNYTYSSFSTSHILSRSPHGNMPSWTWLFAKYLPS